MPLFYLARKLFTCKKLNNPPSSPYPKKIKNCTSNERLHIDYESTRVGQIKWLPLPKQNQFRLK